MLAAAPEQVRRLLALSGAEVLFRTTETLAEARATVAASSPG